jgi:hypothetical protein
LRLGKQKKIQQTLDFIVINKTIRKLTEDNFDEIYTPIQNHLDEDATFDGTMYETYGAN